ncbi:hypothetical protein [Streptomyces sp. NPDC047000]|uniref:hypothetical protein n=1 Tax=Streptomyces sp. NPDC047000 TaxID=3155474 RepID=UPI0033F1D2FB
MIAELQQAVANHAHTPDGLNVPELETVPAEVSSPGFYGECGLSRVGWSQARPVRVGGSGKRNDRNVVTASRADRTGTHPIASGRGAVRLSEAWLVTGTVVAVFGRDLVLSE